MTDSKLKTALLKKRSNAIASSLLKKPPATGIEKCRFAERKKAAKTSAERIHPVVSGGMGGDVLATAAFSSDKEGVFRLLQGGIKIVAGKGFRMNI